MPEYGLAKRIRRRFKDALLAQRAVLVQGAVGQAQHVRTQVGGNQDTLTLEQQRAVARAVPRGVE